MPAVNLPLQLSSGNVTLRPVSEHQVRLLVSITVIILGLLLLSALLQLPRRRYKLPSDTPPTQVDGAVVGQQRLWLSEKSCGVNPSCNNMSSNQTFRESPPRADIDMGREQIGENGKENQEYDSREGSLGGASSSPSIDLRIPGHDKSRPLPPLTPPTPSTVPFGFQTRRLSIAVSATGDFENNSIHHQNPDYSLVSLSGSTSTALSNTRGLSSTPRRRSYTKALPLGPSQPGSAAEDENGISCFSPSSFPSSSPILPPAPHESLEPREINVKGEIISVMNDSGAGWKRHTRVYGGGVCLACMASNSNDDGQGGFYGDNVPLDQRR
ncbi:hypothetical protein F5X99DRAFT_202480 [Biscogniauxia marginata]|nr:hypothetical protein F5X99DRAFT_202480 [Biscogniauxia marginata]